VSDLDAWSDRRIPINTRFELRDGGASATVVDYFDGFGPALQFDGLLTPQNIAGLYHKLAIRQGWKAIDCATQARDGAEDWQEVRDAD